MGERGRNDPTLYAHMNKRNNKKEKYENGTYKKK
jgi:hypothetical protein